LAKRYATVNPAFTGATWSAVAQTHPVNPMSLASLAAFALASLDATPPREPGRHNAPNGCLPSILAATSARVMRKR
jgi:hypothetical protein